MRLGLSMALGAALSASAGGGAPQGPALDWRMTASAVTGTAAVNTTNFQTAQASAAARLRPTFNVANGATESVTYTIDASDTQVLVSFLPNRVVTAAVQVSTDGGDTWGSNLYTATTPNNITMLGRRQVVAIDVPVACMVRVEIANASGATANIGVLLHQMPATGRADSHVIVGASREVHLSSDVETVLIGRYPTRDPIVFSYALSGASLVSVGNQAERAKNDLTGIASYCYLGSMMGNEITSARPYDSSEAATLNTNMATLLGHLEDGGFYLGFGNTSYRQYPNAPAVTPASQDDGSKPYNDNLVHPAIQTYAPHCWDASIGRPRLDEYLYMLIYRRQLNADGIHQGSQLEFWVLNWWSYIYTGTWGASMLEQIVSLAEVEREAVFITEAQYAVDAIVDPTVQATYQDRIDAIVARDGSEYDQVVNISVNSTTAVAASGVTQYWNNMSGAQANKAAVGPGGSGGLVDSAGNAVGIGCTRTQAGLGTTSGATTGSNTGLFPDTVMATAVYQSDPTAADYVWSGLDDARTYDLVLLANRATDLRITRYTVNGVAKDMPSGNNTHYGVYFRDLVPVGGSITVSVGTVPGYSFGYCNGMSMRRQAA